ncbi:MAG: hypothetical protein AAB701_00210 [Patescibacteria group bacterium]
MSERQSGGFESEPQFMEVLQEKWRAAEIKELPRFYSREQLFVDLQLIESAIASLHLSDLQTGNLLPDNQPVREQLDAPSMQTAYEAVRWSFDSIEQRCFDLMWPQRQSVLQKSFPYHYSTKSKTEEANDSSLAEAEVDAEEVLRLASPSELTSVDSGEERWQRYQQTSSVLTDQEQLSIESIDRALDVCQQQRERQGWIAHGIFTAYSKSLGAWPGGVDSVRPWHFFFDQAPSLSEPDESDITPLSEYKENDELA